MNGPPVQVTSSLDDAIVPSPGVAANDTTEWLKTARHAAAVTRIRAAAQQQGRCVAVLQDLAGPKIRTGALAGGVPIELHDGDLADRGMLEAQPLDGVVQLDVHAEVVRVQLQLVPGPVRVPG